MRGRRTVWLSAVLLAALAAVGCVDRRFVVTTNAPGAARWRWTATSSARPQWTPGTSTPASGSSGPPPRVTTRWCRSCRFQPRWYDYPGLDLFAEVIWPFRIEDVRRVHLDLQPAQPVPVDQIQAGAEALRGRGQTLPPPTVPNDQPPIARPTLDPAIPPSMRGLFPPTGSTPIPPTVPGRVNTNR